MAGEKNAFVQVIDVLRRAGFRFEAKVFGDVHGLFENGIDGVDRWAVDAT